MNTGNAPQPYLRSRTPLTENEQSRGEKTKINDERDRQSYYRFSHEQLDMGKSLTGRSLCVTLMLLIGHSHHLQACREDQFTCSDGQCIPQVWTCDGDIDCGDGSDETAASCGDDCGEVNFRCADGECISGRSVCDGDVNCKDGSDESAETCGQNCGGKGDHFTCSNLQCIPQVLKCDGEADCGDGSDETVAVCGGNCGGNFACADGQCIKGRYCSNDVRKILVS